MKKDEERGGCFHTSPQNILMVIKGNPMLSRSKPIETPTKFRIKKKYCEYYEDFGYTASDWRELKRVLYKLGDGGNHTVS